MEIERIEPEWIGANITLAGVPMLSMLPASTLLFVKALARPAFRVEIEATAAGR